MQMTDDMQQIFAHVMGALRTDLPVRILRLGGWDQPTAADSRMSPYLYPISDAAAIIMGAQTVDTHLAWSSWRAAVDTAPDMVGVSAWTPTNAGVRVQLALPEAIFTDLFTDSGKEVQAQGYVTYRNGWYLRWAQRLQRRLPGIAQLLRPSAPEFSPAGVDFTNLRRYQQTVGEPTIGAVPGTVTLAGVRLTERGVLTVDLDLPADCIPDAAHLAALRDLCWLTLAVNDDETAPLPELAQGFANVAGDQGDGRSGLSAMPQEAGQPAGTILPGFEHEALTQQIYLRAGLVAGMGVTPLGTELWSLDGEQQSVIIAGQQVGLNPDAAVALTRNRDALMRFLGTHGLVVPRGNTYRNADAAVADFDRSFGHKSIFVGGTDTQGPGSGSVAMPVPPTPERFAEVVRALGDDIMVQLLAPGSLYRCLVLDGKVLAVQARDYAYVVGDGRRDVAALLAAKRTRRAAAGQPTLALDAGVTAGLARQNVTSASVIPRGTQVYLGRDTAAFVAGEYWDDRASLDQSYDVVAVQAATALGLRYCTVDLAVINGFIAYSEDQAELAQVVGVDATPDLVSFLRPTIGEGNDFAPAVLAAALAK